MKLSTVITIITTALAASVSVAAETNAERFARGLPPLPPMKRATNVRCALLFRFYIFRNLSLSNHFLFIICWNGG